MTPGSILLATDLSCRGDRALDRATALAAEWQALGEDGATLFTYPMGVGVARERIQKDLDWQYNDWGVNALREEPAYEMGKRGDHYALGWYWS